MVIELGTNGADLDLTVEQAEAIYRDGVADVRAQDIWRTGPKRVVRVPPYRVPRIESGALDPGTGVDYEPYQWASKLGVYAEHAAVPVHPQPWDVSTILDETGAMD